MHTDQIYIARDGKSGMHVLVRILAVDDIGVDYPPIDPDNFNKLMMARDVKSLVLAARDLGPMYISADILSRRTFIPSHLQQEIECGFNLIPPNLESLLSECYFDPYAIPDEIAGMGYRAIGRTGKKATRELINELDFTKAGDLSYLDSRFRAIVEPLHDWVFARNLLSILMRIGGLYRSGAGLVAKELGSNPSLSLSGLQGSYINCEVTLTVNGKSKTFVPKAICNGKVSDGIYVRPRIG